MRIDLYLKTAGLLKTRTIAGKAISSGAVSMDGKPVKASSAVEPGSLIILVRPDGETVKLRVLQVPQSKNVSKKARTELYEIIERGESDCF